MAGGSRIIISDEGITISTNGKILYQAGQHKFEKGEKVSTKLPFLPVPDQPYILQFLVKNKDNLPVANKPYFIFDEDGNMQEGVTDSQGFMKIKTTSSSQKIFTRVMTNEIEEAQDANDIEDD